MEITNQTENKPQEEKRAEGTQNTTQETSSDNKPKNTKACATPDCFKPATLQCPTCLKMGIQNNSFFCSQQCFKNYWPIHKYFHKSGNAFTV